MSVATRLQVGILTDQEIEQLLTRLAHQRGGFDEAEAATVIGWARLVRREQRRLDDLLGGDLGYLDDLLPEPYQHRRRRHLELVR